MTFEEVVDQAVAMLQRGGRVAYRMLKRQFSLDDEVLEDLKFELLEGQRLAVDEDERVLIWTGAPGTTLPAAIPTETPAPAPLAYTPPISGREDPHLAPGSGRRAQAGDGAAC